MYKQMDASDCYSMIYCVFMVRGPNNTKHEPLANKKSYVKKTVASQHKKLHDIVSLCYDQTHKLRSIDREWY